jgi:hypothetical protein
MNACTGTRYTFYPQYLVLALVQVVLRVLTIVLLPVVLPVVVLIRVCNPLESIHASRLKSGEGRKMFTERRHPSIHQSSTEENPTKKKKNYLP